MALATRSEITAEESRVLATWVKSFGIGCNGGRQEDQPFHDDFECEIVNNWWDQVKDHILESEIAIFLPCAKATQSGKVIQDSVTHRAFAKAITRWESSSIQRIIVSEPLTIIPYERRDYPAYNYPPPLLRFNNPRRRKDYKLFVERLQSWLKKQKKSHLWIWFGISRHFHHPRILQAAWILGQPLFVVTPRGGTRDIGYAARSLRFLIENALGWETTDSPDDSRLRFDRARYFILTSKSQKHYPEQADIEKNEVSSPEFFKKISSEAQHIFKEC